MLKAVRSRPILSKHRPKSKSREFSFCKYGSQNTTQESGLFPPLHRSWNQSGHQAYAATAFSHETRPFSRSREFSTALQVNKAPGPLCSYVTSFSLLKTLLSTERKVQTVIFQSSTFPSLIWYFVLYTLMKI